MPIKHEIKALVASLSASGLAGEDLADEIDLGFVARTQTAGGVQALAAELDVELCGDHGRDQIRVMEAVIAYGLAVAPVRG